MSPPQREIELKLGLPPDQIRALWSLPQIRTVGAVPDSNRRLHSVYFDTPDLRLRHRGCALRVRGDGERFIQTLKVDVSADLLLHERDEYECAIARGIPNLAAIEDIELRERVVSWIGERELVAVFETDVRRTTRALEIDGTSCRLEVDIGEIRAGDAAAPVSELELELSSGDATRLFELAIALSDALGLRIESESKADRGYALHGSRRAHVLKAEPVELAAEDRVGDAIERIAASCARQILYNLPAAREGIDPEGLHQLRVGVRRLRVALAAFKQALSGTEFERLREELSWLASETGALRDLDVFVEELIASAYRYAGERKPLERIRRDVDALRHQRQIELREVFASARFTRLMLSLGLRLRGPRLGEPDAELRARRLSESVEEFAKRALARRYKRSRQFGERTARGSLPERHALRIELKKLRYLAEFFRDAFPSKPTRRFIRALERLQDVLGELNDVATARRIARQVLDTASEEPDAELLSASSFIDGWTARVVARSDAAIAERWKSFAKRRPFWET